MNSSISTLLSWFKPSPPATPATPGSAQSRRHPAGHTANVVSLQASLAYGMTKDELLAVAGSAGLPLSDPEEWRWQDARGNQLVVAVRRGRVVRWSAEGAQPQGQQQQLVNALS